MVLERVTVWGSPEMVNCWLVLWLGSPEEEQGCSVSYNDQNIQRYIISVSNLLNQHKMDQRLTQTSIFLLKLC